MSEESGVRHDSTENKERPKKRKSKRDMEIERLKNELEKTERESDRFKELAQRVQADFDNYRKRILRESELKDKYGCEALIVRILDVMDTLERAVSHEKGGFKTGLEMIKMQIESTLSEFGVRSFESVGKKFDPALHEAVATGDGDEEGIVIEEYQKGYMLYDKVIRHAKVKVSRR